MKKLYFSLFVALSLLMTACVAGLDNELNRAEISISHYADLIAEIEDGSRTYIEDGKYQYWHEGDLLSVFYGNTLNSQYRFNGKTGDNDGTFSVVENDELSTGNPLNSIYALYPYDATATISDNGTISCTLPSVQTYANNSFGRGANTMVAVTENCEESALHFKNLCGYLKIKLYGNAVINLVELTGNSGEKLAGVATVTALHGEIPTVNMSSEATTSIALNCGDGVTLGKSAEEATEFWFVVPPTTFENGFSIVATNSEGAKFKMSTSKKIAIERNAIQPMEVVEATTFVTAPNNQIFYTSSDGAVVTPYATNVFGANIVSNTYENGKGVIKFDGAVAQIGEKAFYNCNTLTNITIPDSITSIGNGAFRSCTSLTSVTIPDSVTSIGDLAFYHCNSLTSVTIPNSVTSIGEAAFSRCASLEKFYGKFASADNCYLIVNGVLNSFAISCDLAEFTIPNSVTSIGKHAFHGCKSLTSVTIPDSVTEIGISAFVSCTSLTSVTIPDSITSIADAAFGSCTSLTSITIPDSVTSIEGRAFTYCTSLTSITIPDSVTSIGNFAFQSCTSLTSATIGDSVTEIGEWTFWDCTSLTSVYCKPTAPPTGDQNMFYNNASSRKIYVPRNSVSAYKAAEYWKDYADYIEGYNFENGEVAAPQPANNEIWYTSSDSKVVTPNATDVFGANIMSNTYADGKGVITFDGDVTQIGEKAFYNCKLLTSVTIPNSVTTIGTQAFYYCSSLTSVTIGNGVTSIKNRAFFCCTSLTNITIPDSVISIEECVFLSCSSLTTFYGKFASADNKCLIVDGLLNSFAVGCGATEYTIPDSVTSIGDWAFNACRSLTSITIPNSVTSIGSYVFHSCDSLTSVTIGNSVTSIGDAAFSYCSSLTSVTIPDSVTSIGEGAFHRCASLEKFYGKFASADNCYLIVNGVLNSFAISCDLAEFTIPNSVTSIGKYAFHGCKSLTRVTIPDSVISIGYWAFNNCSSLKEVYCKPTTPPTGGQNMFHNNASSRKIYVPRNSVSAYKAATYWSSYAADIVEKEF